MLEVDYMSEEIFSAVNVSISIFHITFTKVYKQSVKNVWRWTYDKPEAC